MCTSLPYSVQKVVCQIPRLSENSIRVRSQMNQVFGCPSNCCLYTEVEK